MVRFKYNNGAIVSLPNKVANQLKKIKSGVILDEAVKKELEPKKQTRKKSAKK